MKSDRGRPGWALDVGALAALDMVFLGRRLVIGEFAVGFAGAGLLGLLSLRAGLPVEGHAPAWTFWLGLELLLIGLNYLPLLLLSLRAARDEEFMGLARRYLSEQPAAARRFGLLQAWILVPFAVVIFAVLQPATSTLEAP